MGKPLGSESKAIAENKNAIIASCWSYFITVREILTIHKPGAVPGKSGRMISMFMWSDDGESTVLWNVCTYQTTSHLIGLCYLDGDTSTDRGCYTLNERKRTKLWACEVWVLSECVDWHWREHGARQHSRTCKSGPSVQPSPIPISKRAVSLRRHMWRC